MTVKETVKALKKYLSDDEHIVVAWWSRDDLGCWDSDGDVDALSEKDWKYCCKKADRDMDYSEAGETIADQFEQWIKEKRQEESR